MQKTVTMTKQKNGFWAGRLDGTAFQMCNGELNRFFFLDNRRSAKFVISDKKLPDSYKITKRGLYGDSTVYGKRRRYRVTTLVSADFVLWRIARRCKDSTFYVQLLP